MRRGNNVGRTGLSLIMIGGALAGYQVYLEGLSADLPTVLVGLSLICFGWSLMTKERRRQRERQAERDS